MFGIASAALTFAGPVVAQPSSPFARRLVIDTGRVTEATISPDGRWVVHTFARQPGARGLWIRPAAGGAARLLLPGPDDHRTPQFTPNGDALLFASTRGRRGPGDEGYYLVSATFDASAGRLSSDARPVSPDPVALSYPARPAISPDGSRVAYVVCCAGGTGGAAGDGGALRVAPLSGVESRTLPRTLAMAPTGTSFPSWSPDGEGILYLVRERAGLTRYRVPAIGGTPQRVTVSDSAPLGRALPGTALFVATAGPQSGGAPGLRFLDERGRPVVGVLELPWAAGVAEFSASPTGREVVVVVEDVITATRVATTRVTSETAAATRSITGPGRNEWPIGWLDTATLALYSDSGGRMAYRIATADGKAGRRLPLPEGLMRAAFPRRGALIERVGWRINGAEVGYERLDLDDGSRREFARGVFGKGCCRVPGGAEQASDDDFVYLKWAGPRLELRAWSESGGDRPVARLPAAVLGTHVAVYGNRVAYTRIEGDSVRLMVQTPAAGAVPLHAFPRDGAPTEFSWSPDGRQMVVAVGPSGRHLLRFRFDPLGVVRDPPQALAVPVRSLYSLLWLPDGNALVMLTDTGARGQTLDVARLDLPDGALTVLTPDDPGAKVDLSLSTDGQRAAYASSRTVGTSIWVIDVEKARASLSGR